MQNTELFTVVDGGVQTPPPSIAIQPQIIYLDFDGELTSYHNCDLEIHIDNVAVEESCLTAERIAAIVNALNDDFAVQNVVFVTERPTDSDFSTIYVGKTSSFDEYGNFAGLAETVDVGNSIKNDNAFVMLDSTADNSAIVATISHEAQHLVGALEHEGYGIGRYAEAGFIYYYYVNNKTFTGILESTIILSQMESDETIFDRKYQSTGGDVSSCLGYHYVYAHDAVVNKGILCISSGGTANNITVNSGGDMKVSNGGRANGIIVNSWGSLVIDSGGTASEISVNPNGILYISSGAIASGIILTHPVLYNFTVASNTHIEWTSDGSAFEIEDAYLSGYTVDASGWLYVLSGGIVDNTNINSARINISNGATAHNTTINYGVFSIAGGTAYLTYASCGGSALCGKGGVANSNTAYSGGSLKVSGVGATLNDNWINSGGVLWTIGSGIANNTTIESGGTMYVSTGGIANSVKVNSGALLLFRNTGILKGEILVGGTLSRWNVVTANEARIIYDLTQRHPEEDVMVYHPSDYVGATYSISVSDEQELGMYRLATEMTYYQDDISLTIEGTEEGGVFRWEGDNYNTITINGNKYTLGHYDEVYNDVFCLKIEEEEFIKIIDFETLKLAVSSNWQKYSATVELPDFNDGWGRQTNHRSWASISVTNASIVAQGTSNQVNVTLKAKMAASLGIISFEGDISQEGQGLFLTVSKADNGWEFTDWDLVGTVSATLQQVDRRQKFHLLNTTFDPKKISVTADINTRTDVYTIRWDYKKSGYGIFQDMSLTATLIRIPVAGNSDKYEFDLSAISLRLADDPTRVRYNSGMHIYEINMAGRNLSKTVTAAPEFSGSIGFTWMSTTLRLGKYAWQRKLLDSAGIDYASGGEVKFSVIDTKLNISMNLDGDFSAGGDVKILCAGSKALVNINGQVTYKANQEMLTVSGMMSLMGISGLNTRVISVPGALRAEAEGYIKIPGWARWLSGYSLAAGHAIVVYNSQKTVISFWGELLRKNGTYSVKGYSYNLTTGEAKDISEKKDIDDVYIEASTVLEIGKKASATCHVTEEEASKMSKVSIQGSYANASDSLTVSICNETTNESYQFSIGADKRALNDGRTRSNDNDENDVNVALLDEQGFSIEFSAFSAGTWKVEVQDNGAELNDFDLWLEYESTNECHVDSFSIIDMSSYSVDFSYSVIGGNDETTVELYCRNTFDAESEGINIYLDNLIVGENLSYTWTQSNIMDDGEYEFFLRVSGDFIPFESEAVGCFIVDNKKLSETVQVVEEVIDDGEATILHPILSVQYEHYEISFDNENWQKVGNDYVLTTDSATELYVRGYDADSETYGETEKISIECLVELIGEDQFAWNSTIDDARFRVKLTSEAGAFFIETNSTALSVICNRNEHLQGRVQLKGTGVWTDDYALELLPESDDISVLSAANDGSTDVFMATVNGTWENKYQAKHVGVGEWTGTREKVALGGKNIIADIFAGADDASILLLTDDENGDALFVDDIYSALPTGVEAQSRIAKIDEIRAGAGDDIIDLTSQRFEYVGGGIVVKGGLGDDVIWANNGNNWLFGDGGDDRIVGAAGDDVIVGGIGNDTLHGGGGDDVFCFGGNWGNDSVEQRAGGKVTLWFDGVARDELSLTADADGNAVLSSNKESVTLVGVEYDYDLSAAFVAGNQLSENLSLRFENDGSRDYSILWDAGAFEPFTSEKIFEDSGRGMLV